MSMTASVSVSGDVTSDAAGAPISLGYDAQTPEQISIYCPTTRAVHADTSVSVRYRANGASTWIAGHPLLHIVPAEVTTGAPVMVVDAFAGAIFDLSPGVTYDVELTVSEPGYTDAVLTGTRATRALPAAAGTPNKTLTTAGNLQTTLDGLLAGDVLQLSDGTYTVSSLTLSAAGSSGSPIYVRGATKAGVIIKDTTGAVLSFAQTCSHLVLENLTIEGSSTDSGTSATSIGIVFANYASGTPSTNVTIRSVDFVGVDIGIKSYTRLDGCLVYGCTLAGNNTWDKAYIDNGGLPNLTWNDDGICLPGLGNAAWNNTLTGFGDAFATYGSYSLGEPAGIQSAAVFFYRNLVEMTGDDACEGDYSTRNIGFYDNYVGNSATLLSLDPVWGGPFFCFRNTSVNSIRGPFKLTNQNSGALIYNNTLLKGTIPTVGGNEYGWYSSNNGLQQGISFRNNLMVKRGSGTDMRLEFDATRIDFTHNAWYPNSGFNWTNAGGNFASAALAAAGLPTRSTLFGSGQRHSSDVAVTSNPWAETVTLGADYTTEYTSMQRMVLSGGSGVGSGVSIPGITDGFSGSSPDRGAEIAGRAAITYGASGVAANIVGTDYTPARYGSGLVMDSDIAQLPRYQFFRVVPLSGFPTSISQVQVGPDLPKPNGSNGHQATVTAWSGAAYVPGLQWSIGGGAGHTDSSGAQNDFNGIKWPSLTAHTFIAPSALADVLKQANSANDTDPLRLVTEIGGPENYAPAYSLPVRDAASSSGGRWGATHTYDDGIVYVPPAAMALSGFSGNVLGGIFYRATASTIIDLDSVQAGSPTWSKLWWKGRTAPGGEPGVPDDTWQMGMLVGTVFYQFYNSFNVARFDLSQTEFTRWQTELASGGASYDPTPGTPSRIKQLTNVSLSAKAINYSGCTTAKLARGTYGAEWVNISASVVRRVRVGQLHADIAATTFGGNVDTYVDDITLTSSDGSHTQFSSSGLYADGSAWYRGGHSYQASEDALYLFPCTAGTEVVRVTGLSGSTWTTESLTGSGALNNSPQGLYGRAAIFTIGGKRYMGRYTYGATEVARLDA